VIEEREDERALRRAKMAHIEVVATPHLSLPLKGGGEESEATSFPLGTVNRTAVVADGGCRGSDVRRHLSSDP